jgi:tetratricopeptide (TPR) repeat protein
MALLVLAGICLSLAQLSVRAEVVEMKKGGRIEGEVVELTADTLKLKVGEAIVSVAVRDVAPYSFYELRLRRMDPKDAAARFALAVYCIENNLFSEARRELSKTVELDASLAQEVEAKSEEIRKKEPAFLLEKSQALLKQEKYDEAMKELQSLLRIYPEGEQATAARKVLADTAAEIRKKNEEKEKVVAQIEKKKVDDRAQEAEKMVADRFERAAKRIEEAKELNAEGLNREGENKFTLADKAYVRAAERLLEVKVIVQETLANSKDVDVLAAAKDKLAEVNRWLVIVYTNLGNLYALEQNYREALKWLNRALVIDQTDRVAVELKLRVCEQIIRRGWQ